MEIRKNDLFINLGNKKQVKWWNRIGSYLVKAKCHSDLLDETNQVIGHFVWLNKGIFNRYVIRKMNKLLKNKESI